MKKTNTALAVTLALGLSTFSASALAVTYTQSNFTMRGSALGGGLVGGTNDVTAVWDGTFNTAATDTNVNMTISSPTTFFGHLWSAYNIRVFAPGTYTISTADTAGGAGCPTAAPALCASGGNYTVTVPTDQIMAHMKFAWNGAEGIDVINVWQKNAVFAPSKMCVTQYDLSDPANPVSYCGSSNSNGDNPANTVWDLMSTDVDGNGINGLGMIDGPFSNFNANFNLKVVPVPAAVWLFGSGLMGFMALARRKKTSR